MPTTRRSISEIMDSEEELDVALMQPPLFKPVSPERPGTIMDRRLSFLSCLAQLERWLASEKIPYTVFGSVAATAWIDRGASLDFDRPGARDPAERIPDIDLLVPRASLDRVKRYART